MNHVTRVRLYRYDGHVALSVGSDDEAYQTTIYITQDMAFDIAEVLRDIGADIYHVPFSKSTLGTQVVNYAPDRCHESIVEKE